MPSPFEVALGLYQGRIRPTNWTPEHGDYVYQLGHDLPGQTFRISFGSDSHEVTQTADVTSGKLVRFVIHERGPATIPDGQAWNLETLLDGSVVLTLPLAAGRTRTRHDLALDVSTLSGNHDIAVALRAAGSDIAEAELPGVYVDGWTLTTEEDARPTIFNRDPEPGDTGVPDDASINFDIVDLDGAGVAKLIVYVDGVLAIDSGVLQAPWSTSGSGVATISNGFRVGLVPTDPWESQSVHVVRVVAQTADNVAIDEEWSFTVEDLTPPKLLTAFAPTETTVQLVFDEALGAGVATVGNYTLALQSGAPAVVPGVVSAAVTGPGTVLLTLDKPQTPLAVYSVTVEDVEDAWGNAIAAPDNVAQWVGYECPKPAGRKLDLYAMWPRAYREDDTGDLRGFIAIFQEVTDLILCVLDRYVGDVLDPDTALEEHVDRILQDLGNPFHVPLALEDKRRLLRVLVPLLRRKGTEKGIEDAIRTLLGLEVDVVPVVDMMAMAGLGEAALSDSFALATGALGSRLAFDIEVPTVLTAEQTTLVTRIANIMRRGVCHLRNIVQPSGDPPADLVGLGEAKFSDTFILGGG